MFPSLLSMTLWSALCLLFSTNYLLLYPSCQSVAIHTARNTVFFLNTHKWKGKDNWKYQKCITFSDVFSNMMIIRANTILFLLISICIDISLTSTRPQCCPLGFSLNPDRLTCVSGDNEVQVEGLDRCKGDKEVVETRDTKLSYHGSKLGHRRSYNILHFNIQACCTGKQPSPLVSSACLAWWP